MRCRQARQRLSRLTSQQISSDSELRGHLQNCRECAWYAHAEQRLSQDLAATRPDDAEGDLSWSALKVRVNGRAASAAGKNPKETSIMSRIVRRVQNRPRFGLTAVAVIAIALIATLIPFKFNQTVGYEVAVAGVSPDLALDVERVNLLLQELGIGHAEVEMGDCNVTCKMFISELGSDEEVQLVVQAFDAVGNCVVDGIDPVQVAVSQSLAGHAIKTIQIGLGSDNLPSNCDFTADQMTIQTVNSCLDKLGGDSCEFTIWMCADPENNEVIDINMVSANCGQALPDGNITIDLKTIGDTAYCLIASPDGTFDYLPLDDPKTAERLRELGLDAAIIDCSTISKSGCATIYTDQANQEPAAAKTTLVPDKFALSQNYPNPFNPSTNIDFSLPQGERVTLQIYNIQGQRVRTLVDSEFGAGHHTVEWDGTTDAGDRLASGVYLYRIDAGDFSESKKMSLVK